MHTARMDRTLMTGGGHNLQQPLQGGHRSALRDACPNKNLQPPPWTGRILRPVTFYDSYYLYCLPLINLFTLAKAILFYHYSMQNYTEILTRPNISLVI